MRRFAAADGTVLAYRSLGSGPVLVCVPGGPGQAGQYLGDLGGLDAYRTLVVLDNRGTGDSAVPADPATYRVERIVDDVEALRRHLDLQRMDLLVHSASAGVGLLYADAYAHRLARLVVVAPSLRVLGLASDRGVGQVLARRAHEPWYAEAVAALTAQATTAAQQQRHQQRAAPLLYGRWDDAARAQAAAEPAQFSDAARQGFYAGFVPDPGLPARLAAASASMMFLAGELDIWPTVTAVRDAAARCGDVEVRVQPSAGHFPWVDDPAAFTAAVLRFLQVAR